jgi:DNA-binding LacI/PurR family transcriptional regulator
VIGLVLDGPSEAFFPALLDGFEPELLLRVAADREAAVAVYRRWRAERKVDGVLLTAPDHAADLARIGLPAVLLGGRGGLDVPSVRVDDTAGAAEALEYLAALGHRHVARIPGAAAFADAGEREEAFAAEVRRLGLAGVGAAGAGDCRGGNAGPTGLPVAGAGNRRAGWVGGAGLPAAGGTRWGESAGTAGMWAGGSEHRRGAQQAGMRVAGSRDRLGTPGAKPATARENRPTVHIEPSADAVRHVLTAHPRPTALLCDTDSLAVAALVAARELGLAVPGDLSVVSWDDSELCRLVRPALSAIRRPLPELGGLAASMLRDLIAGEEVGDVWTSRPRLVTRGSTGPAR